MPRHAWIALQRHALIAPLALHYHALIAPLAIPL